VTATRVYRLVDPFDQRFADAGRHGTWYPDPGPGVCPECGSSQQRRVPPLRIEWLPGSDLIGDFTWPGGDIVVLQRVRDALEKDFHGFEFGPIEMWQAPRIQRPRRATKRTKPRVWLPYEGPPLSELWIQTWVHTDLGRSSVRLVKVCSTCDRKFYEVTGVERRKSRWDPVAKGLVEVHTPRAEGEGIYVHRKDLQDCDIFGVCEFPIWALCTEGMKAFIQERQFTNVSFLEVGNILG